MMIELTIRAKTGGAALARRVNRLVLDIEREWVIEGSPSAVDGVRQMFPEFVDVVSNSVALLTFRNCVGRHRVPGLGEIELVSGKWSEADFNAMLQDLTDIAAALPFSYRSHGGVPYERVWLAQEPVPYHAYIYLRYALSESAPAHDRFDLALEQVLAQPHRRLVPAHRTVSLERACKVGTRGMLRSLTSPWGWREVGESGSAFASALRGHLPSNIEEEARNQSVDTPENRFVRMVLDGAHSVIQRMQRYVVESMPTRMQSRVLSDCEGMLHILTPLRQHPFWREVGTTTQVSAESPVLQRQYGYREVLKTFVRLRLISRLPFDADAIEDLLSLKNIAALYELWCYFSIVQEVQRLLGPPSEGAAPRVSLVEVSTPQSAHVTWSDGTRLIYNARFSKKSTWRSTSLPLRPDVALYVPSGVSHGLHLFDAKFRLTAMGDIESLGKGGPATFKNQDLYKMHAYRDAIPDARSVWVLYPGTEFLFFPANGVDRNVYDGVGVIPAQPRQHQHIGKVVARLLGRAED
jgi:predicted component of viral defense system (DUF524 family)